MKMTAIIVSHETYRSVELIKTIARLSTEVCYFLKDESGQTVQS